MGAKVKSIDVRKWLEDMTAKVELIAEHAMLVAERAALDYIARTTRFNDRTGKLRQSFTRTEFSPRGLTLQPTGGPERYAGFVEFGTTRIQARRYGAFAQTAGENALYAAIDRRLSALSNGT